MILLLISKQNIATNQRLYMNLLHYHSFNILRNFLHDIVLIDYISGPEKVI